MERRRAIVFLFVSAQTALVSVAGIVFSAWYAMQGLRESSFYAYFSLVLSDPDIVLAYWKEFVLSLADTIPFMEITVVFVAVAVFLVSVRILAQNMRFGLSPSFSHS